MTFDYLFGIRCSGREAVSTTLVAHIVSLLVICGDTSLTKEENSEPINQIMRVTVNNGTNLN